MNEWKRGKRGSVRLGGRLLPGADGNKRPWGKAFIQYYRYYDFHRFILLLRLFSIAFRWEWVQHESVYRIRGLTKTLIRRRVIERRTYCQCQYWTMKVKLSASRRSSTKCPMIKHHSLPLMRRSTFLVTIHMTKNICGRLVHQSFSFVCLSVRLVRAQNAKTKRRRKT